jgi:hypothetical protein
MRIRFFFKGVNINIMEIPIISSLQQDNALAALRMHTAQKKKKELQERKVPLQGTIPHSNNTDTTRTTPVVHHSNNNAFKKETVHKCRHCPIKDHRFSP